MELTLIWLLIVLSLCSHSGVAAERPTAVVSLSPKWSPVFSGESITLTCSIQGESSSDWRYRWYRGDQQLHPQRGWSDSDRYRLQSVQEDHSGDYSCQGSRQEDAKESYMSEGVTLTVLTLPTATLTIEPESPVYVGEEVTLKCKIQSEGDWAYKLFKGSSSDHLSQSDTNTLTITAAAKSDESHYWCQGEMRGRAVSSLMSGSVYLTVKALPTPTLSVQPETHVFTGEDVTLKCEIESEGVWKYKWYKEWDRNVLTLGDTNTFTIRGAAESHKGQYWCQGERRDRPTASQPSRRITLDVKGYYCVHECVYGSLPTAIVTVDPPEGPYYPGDEITLRCDIAGHTDFQYNWYRGSDSIHYQNSQSITISLPDRAGKYQYTCDGRGNGPKTSQRSTPVSVSVTDFPVPTLTVQPSHVFTGEAVTLTCIQPSTGWTYAWDTPPSSRAFETNSNIYTISRASVSDQGEYKCYGVRERSRKPSRSSNTVQLIVKALPLATLTVEPQSPVFTGETVTLKCVIESLSGWTYKWYKESSRTPVSEGNIFTIRGAAESHKGQYWCQGERRDRSILSQPSRRITLDVKASKPKLTLSPAHQLLTGDSVTLRCELGVSSGLVFYWYRDTQTSDPVAQTDGDSYSISSVKVSDGGQYWCRAGRRDPVYNTQYSDEVVAEIKFTGVSLASVMIPSNWTQIFTSEPLSLSCGVQGNSTGWRLRWFTGRGGESECPNDWRSETGSSCSISSAAPSDSGVYWCQSESGEQSNPVNITVHNGDVILESPVHPVTEGDSLTLRCRYRYQISNIRADFYKDGTLLQTSTTGEMTIPTVSKSHEGLYKCSNSERGESPESWITVRDARSSGSSKFVVAVGVVIGLLFALALVILLVLLLYRSQKAKGSFSVTPNPGPGSQQREKNSGHSSTSQKRV
ncbi:Fc receptor-like protein 5 [Sardina pilchardus]|uniref:Fc receptor-like protein 5 n=1 Tax=Sardina pilchardus TaxID=27697 RepID=UPI002E162857